MSVSVCDTAAGNLLVLLVLILSRPFSFLAFLCYNSLLFQPKRLGATMMEPAIEVGVRRKTFFQTALPVFACGAGLFSDGYVNNVIGSVNTVLKLEYGTVYTDSNASKYVSDIAFVGTVVGQLFFGFLADRWSRSNSLLVSTVILIVFTALATGSYYHGDAVGMFNMLTAWRFFVGIGIGGMSFAYGIIFLWNHKKHSSFNSLMILII